MSSLKIAKKQVRQLVKQRLKESSPASISLQSANISTIVRSLPEYKNAKKIAYYLHMDQHEIETHLMISNAFDDDKRVFLPRIVDVPTELHGKLYKSHKKDLAMIEIGSLEEIDKLIPHGPYQLREPDLGGTDAFQANGLDMIVLPGVGFTKACSRIGHGKGFYDTFITKHSDWSNHHDRPRPFLVAIGAREQLLDSIPTEDHDHHLDAVIIDTKLYRNHENSK